jgi:hypothetical protein
MLSLATRIICFVLVTHYVKAALESPEYYFAGTNSTSNKRQYKYIPINPKRQTYASWIVTLGKNTAAMLVARTKYATFALQHVMRQELTNRHRHN